MLCAAEFAVGFDLFQMLLLFLSPLSCVTGLFSGGLTPSVPLCQADVTRQGAVTEASWGEIFTG